MRFTLLLRAAALALATGAAMPSAALGRAIAHAACVPEGTVIAFLPTASHNHCPQLPLVVATPLYRADTLRAQAPAGQLTFHSDHLDRCTLYAVPNMDGVDRLYPSATVALLHLSGKTWCRKTPKSARVWLTTKNARIIVTGTIFGLTTVPLGSLIQVAQGTVVVSSIARPSRTVRVPAGFQVLVLGTRVGKPTRLDASPADTEAITSLKLDIATTALENVPIVFSGVGDIRGVLVGESAEASQQVVQQLPGLQLAQFTRAQLADDPQAAAEIRQAAPRTVVVAGTFTTMTPAFQQLRDLLGSSPIILFVPVQ